MEIEFRGIKHNSKEWVYGSYLAQKGCYEIWNDIGDYSVIPETVGQYTGLRDKNGKKIYHNDIVRSTDTNWGYGGEYDKINDGYKYHTIDIFKLISNGYYDDIFDDNWWDLVEVIGNIHTSEKEKAKQMPYTEKETCVACGRYVPEGRMVCPVCEKEAKECSDINEDMMKINKPKWWHRRTE